MTPVRKWHTENRVNWCLSCIHDKIDQTCPFSFSGKCVPLGNGKAPSKWEGRKGD